MAIGLGRMLGFRFLENFNYPFLADNITDFWRRCMSPWERGSGIMCISRWAATRADLPSGFAWCRAMFSGVLFGGGSLYLLLTYGGMLLLCTIAATPLRKACYEKLNARLGQPGADICRLRRTRLCVGGVHGVFSQRQLQSVPVLPILR